MVEKGIRGGISHAVHLYAKTTYKYIKNFDENKESLYHKYWDVNNLCRCGMTKKLPVDGFQRIKNIS